MPAEDVDGASGKGQFRGLGYADDPLQQKRPAIAGDDPQLDEALGEAGTLAGDANITHARKIQPGTDCRSVDGRDHGHFEIEQRQRNTVNAVLVVIAVVDGFERWILGSRQHCLDVAAGAEGRSGSCQYDGADRRIGFHTLAGCLDGSVLRVVGQRVASRSSVERKCSDTAIDVDPDEIAHITFLRARSASSSGSMPRRPPRMSALASPSRGGG